MMVDPCTESVPYRATERQASRFTSPWAQRDVWRGAARTRRQAAAEAPTPDECRYQTQLALAYEARADAISTE